MAWIYKNQKGQLKISNIKPEKLYIFKYRRYKYLINKDNAIPFDYKVWLTEEIRESRFNESNIVILESSNMYYELSKDECVWEGDYSGVPIKLKPETISALKSVVDLENLTIEDGLIEI